MNRTSVTAGILIVLITTLPLLSVAGEMSYGVRAGVGGASFQNTDYEAEFRPGIHFGGFAEYGLSEIFAIKLEAAYAMKGVKGEGYTVALDYIDIPLLAVVSFPASGFEPTFFCGPAFGFKVSADLTYPDGGTFEYGDLVESYEANLVFGLGVKTQFEGQDILFDIRYSHGLTRVFDFELPSDSDSNDKNKVISANISLTIF